MGDKPDAVLEEDRLPLARAITASFMDVLSCENAKRLDEFQFEYLQRRGRVAESDRGSEKTAGDWK